MPLLLISIVVGCATEQAPTAQLIDSQPATAETTRELGIATWNLMREPDGRTEMRGVDAAGQLRYAMSIAVTEQSGKRTFEATSSDGGRVRSSTDGSDFVVERDSAAFAALGRDLHNDRAGATNTEYGCSFWGWAACYAAAADAGAVCGLTTPADPVCWIALAAYFATCGPCYE